MCRPLRGTLWRTALFLPKHPRLMNDDELAECVRSLIERKAPESGTLDYKANISIRSEKEKIEIAKDITSFANEKGGVLLYGVPEEYATSDSVPIPKELAECGIELPNGLPEIVENTMLDIIEPSLPELEIRVLEFNSKSILFIYHPESWLKPHMLEGYKHGRYYKRGNFRAIIMDEKDIEAAYLFRKTIKVHADEFFQEADFGVIPEDGYFLRITLCPHYPLFLKEKMHDNDFIKWIEGNSPGDRMGRWQPFIEGWCFRSHPLGRLSGNRYEFRLFFNGGISYTLDLEGDINPDEKVLRIPGIVKTFSDTYLDFAIKFFDHFGISGPVSMQTSIHNAKGINADKFGEYNYEDERMTSIPLDSNLKKINEETSVEGLKDLNVTSGMFRYRLGSAFGLWLKNK